MFEFLSFMQLSRLRAVTLGLYFHIPFCQAKCNYCHFVSMPYEQEATERYIKALLREIGGWDYGHSRFAEIDSIYFGGGTPSILPECHIQEILAACNKRLQIAADCEVSVEANPGTISTAKATAYQKSGINRISLGAQSFVDQELSSIGRTHTAATIFDAVRVLKESNANNLNLDLMLGLPFQTRASWRRNLETIASLEIPHISIYMLDLDDQCALYSDVARGAIRLPEDDFVSDLYLETIELLSSWGYSHYEISNFSKPGFECRHNLKYWLREPFHGFGLASHSFDGSSRYANKPGIMDYLDAIENGKSPIDWKQPIGTEQAFQESLFLGLRLTQGISRKKLNELYGSESLANYEVSFRDLSDRGFVKLDGDSIRLTPSGMLISNEIFQLFV
jgi:oxygen-independent coproporphyrinogen III oxidase